MKFFALIAVASAVSLSAPYTAGDGTVIDEASSNPTVNDRTGTYSPKGNMWTGYEGSKTGNAYSFNYYTNGGHAAVNRVQNDAGTKFDLAAKRSAEYNLPRDIRTNFPN